MFKNKDGGENISYSYTSLYMNNSLHVVYRQFKKDCFIRVYSIHYANLFGNGHK